jgi:hypothetical protein
MLVAVLDDNADAVMPIDTSASEPERLITLEQLAHGSERVGGMVVRSAQVRKA